MSPDPTARRRDLLLGGSGAVLGAAVVGGSWGIRTAGEDRSGGEQDKDTAAAPAGPPAAPPTRRFVSTQLTVPDASLTVAATGPVAPGLTFTTPRTPQFRGVAWDVDGEPVWIEPDGGSVTDLRVQTYRGRPVLTYWTGEIKEGTGSGKGVLLDESYRVVAEVRAGAGVLADIHEFQLTDSGTALITSYPTMPMDLTPIDGPAEGWIWGGRVQEVDVATGEVLLDWEGTDHIDLEESVRALADTGADPLHPFDPIHVNSVEEWGPDHLLLSARHTSTLYRIHRRTGEVVWRLGGKRSDFEVPEEATFGWQHDARVHADGTISIYDNHDNAEEPDEGVVSAGLQLRLDEAAGTVEVVRALRHEDRYGYAMGNAQWLEDDHVLVGWGMDPYATEFDADGNVVWELGGLGLGSYRSWRGRWTGRPTTSPDVAVAGGAVHLSWNGATEVARWRLLGHPAQRTRDAGRPLTTVPRDGFETTVDVTGAAWVSAEALDAGGRVLGRTRRVGV